MIKGFQSKLGKKYAELKSNKRKGFTLIELVVVIAIIGILALIMVPNLTAYISKADDAKVKANLKTVHTAAEIVRQTNESGDLDFDEISKYSNVEAVKVDGSPATGLKGFTVELEGVAPDQKVKVSAEAKSGTISFDGTKYLP